MKMLSYFFHYSGIGTYVLMQFYPQRYLVQFFASLMWHWNICFVAGLFPDSALFHFVSLIGTELYLELIYLYFPPSFYLTVRWKDGGK